MDIFSHGTAITSRLNNPEYSHEHLILKKIKVLYRDWKNSCLEIENTSIDSIKELISNTTSYLNLWKDDEFTIIRRNGQCKVYPSIMEEFFRYIFKDIVTPPFVCGTSSILAGLMINPDFSFIPGEPEFIPQVIASDFCIGRRSSIYKNLLLPTIVLEQKKYADKAMRSRHEQECNKLKSFNKDLFYGLVVMQIPNSYSGPIINERWNYTTYLINRKPDEIDLNEKSIIKLFGDVNEALKNSEESVRFTQEKAFERGYF